MRIGLAQPSHEAQLRRLAAEQAMPGWIRLAFTREPDWFAAGRSLGYLSQTIVGEDDAGRVLGCGCRSIRRVYVNGIACRFGYLSGLRALPEAIRAGGLARGYRFLRQLHDADGLAPAYLTTIVAGNHAALRVLTRRRGGLPDYVDQGLCVTAAVCLNTHHRPKPLPDGLVIERGDAATSPEIVAFLAKEGPRRQFFPVLDPGVLADGSLAALAWSDFLLARRHGRMVGVTAMWDQGSFRQTRVAGYAPAVRVSLPMLNAWMRLRGYRPLPSPGGLLRSFHTAFTCIEGDDVAVFGALLDGVHAAAQRRGHHHFIVGLHQRDPLAGALRRFRTFTYASRLYVACWGDGRRFCDVIDPGRIPHLETAML